MNSELHRFGIDPNEPPDARQWGNVCQLLKALVTNPHLNVGNESSEVVFPVTIPGGKGTPAAASTSGAFCGLYTDEDGHTWLQGGTVTGGHGGTVSISDYKVIDSGTGGTSVEGTVLYLKADCTATVEDGLLMPGSLLNTAVLTTTGGTNHTFTVAADTGDLYYEIGRWTADTFLPAGSGNLHASGCIGSFSLARI